MSQSKPMAADHLATTTLSTLPTTSLGPFSLSLLFLDIHRLGSGGAKLSYAVMKKIQEIMHDLRWRPPVPAGRLEVVVIFVPKECAPPSPRNLAIVFILQHP